MLRFRQLLLVLLLELPTTASAVLYLQVPRVPQHLGPHAVRLDQRWAHLKEGRGQDAGAKGRSAPPSCLLACVRQRGKKDAPRQVRPRPT